MKMKLSELSEDQPYLVLAIIGLITVGMIYGATQIETSTEMEEFLPQDLTSVKVTEEVENKTGGTIYELILVEGEDLSSENAFRSIMGLQTGLKQKKELKKYVKQAVSYPSYLLPRIENYQSLENEELKSRIHILLSNPQIKSKIKDLLSQDKRYALVTILVDSEVPHDNLIKMTGSLHNYTKNYDESHKSLTLSNTGTLSMEKETKAMMNNDRLLLVGSAVIVIVLILYLAFRRPTDILLPFFVLGLGAIWMLGLMGLAGIVFNQVYVALVPIILGIGVDYTIHMLNRYYEERDRGLAVGKSAVKSVRTVGIAISLTAITTIIGFASFGVSDLPPLQNFGFLAGFGVFFIFTLATTMLPALLVIRDRGGKNGKKESSNISSSGIGKLLSRVELGAHKYKKYILIGTALITLLCVVSSAGLTTTMSYDAFLPKDSDSIKTMEKIESRFGGQTMQSYVLTSGQIYYPQNLQLIENLEESIQADPKNENIITGTDSIADLISYAAGGEVPQDTEMIQDILKKLEVENPQQLNRLLLDKDKAVIYFDIQADTSKETDKAVKIIRSNVKRISNQTGTDIKLCLDEKPAVGGAPAIIADIMESILPDMRNSIILAIILVIVVLSLIFRSALIGLVGSIPVIIALFWEFGAIRGLGWSLDVMNMMVSALAIGIGIDFTIHMTHRFREEWKGNGKTAEESISTAIQSVGRAIIAAAATTIGVFAVLSISSMPPIARFGQLAALVIFFSLVAALVVLPSVLLGYAHWRGKGDSEN